MLIDLIMLFLALLETALPVAVQGHWILVPVPLELLCMFNPQIGELPRLLRHPQPLVTEADPKDRDSPNDYNCHEVTRTNREDASEDNCDDRICSEHRVVATPNELGLGSGKLHCGLVQNPLKLAIYIWVANRITCLPRLALFWHHC